MAGKGKGIIEIAVVRRRQLHIPKEIRENAIEQRNVGRQEFRCIHITDRSQHEHSLFQIRAFLLVCCGCSENGNDGAHAIVVVALR